MGADPTLAQRSCRLDRESLQTKRGLSPKKNKPKAEGLKELQPLFSLLGVNTRIQQVSKQPQKISFAGSWLATRPG